MISAEQTNQIKDLLGSGQTILVLLGRDPSLDQVAAAAALVTGLRQQGKTVTLASPGELPQAVADRLPGLPEVQQELGNRDLSISFEYRPEAVDKVSYHIDDQTQRFHLVIKPQRGHKPLDSQTVEFAYTGADANLIFLIGVHQFEALEQLYYGYEQLYADTTVITFHTFETAIGAIKLNTSGSSSLSEAMALFLQELGVPLVPESATQLLAAVEDTTDSFRSLATTADTFEVVAQLLRYGARRMRRQATNGVVPMKTTPVAPSNPTPAPAGAPLAEAMKKSGKKGQPGDKANQKKEGGLDFQPSPSSIRGG